MNLSVNRSVGDGDKLLSSDGLPWKLRLSNVTSQRHLEMISFFRHPCEFAPRGFNAA